MQPEPMDPRQQEAVAAYHRLRRLRHRVALGLAVLGLGAALFFWFGKRLFTIDPGTGTPIGLAVRTDAHIAMLLQRLEAYVPSPARDHGRDTYSVSLLLVPVDGEAPVQVPISGGHAANALGLARVLGSDGQVLWFQVNGLGGVDLRTHRLVAGEALRQGPPADLSGAARTPFAPRIGATQAAGLMLDAHTWLGLLSEAEVQGAYAPGQWLRRITHAEEGKHQRRLYRATLGDSASTGSRRIVSLLPVGDSIWYQGSFLRAGEQQEPYRLQDPDGALLVYTSAPGLRGTLVLARVDADGRPLWRTDTQLDRFTLAQVLPGPGNTAFLGTRLPEPGRVPEPLLVLVDHATGRAVTHSLWR